MARVKSVLCVYLRGEIIFLLHHLLWLLAKLIVKEVTVEMEGVSRALTLILEGWQLFYIFFMIRVLANDEFSKLQRIWYCVSKKEHRASKKKLIGNSYLTLHGTSSTLAHAYDERVRESRKISDSLTHQRNVNYGKLLCAADGWGFENGRRNHDRLSDD